MQNVIKNKSTRIWRTKYWNVLLWFYYHKFSKNIYLYEEIKYLPQICTLQSYHETYQNFIKVCISLLSIFGSNMNEDEDQFDQSLEDFLLERRIEELRSKIDDIEIKNIVKSTQIS